MLLNYSDIQFDSDGRVEIPELMLRTLHDDVIGPIHGAHAIKLNVKLSEPSELEFDIPAKINGTDNPIYDRVTGHKQIYTSCYGIYETLNPTTEDDGITVVKHITAYSLEKTLSSKRFFLEEGTFNFWNPALPDDTILGRVIEKAPGWLMGYVSPSLWNIYRTFEQIDDELLNFVYSTLDEKYECCVVFDTYSRTINVYDRNVDLGTIPVYLDHDNLINELKDEEKSEELVTALRPYGADKLSIREVNPTGSPWIYDLTNFIENGDLPDALATKWRTWEAKIAARREYYIALISLRASTSARLISEKAKLTDLEGELTALQTERNAIIQALGMATDVDRETWQTALTNKTNQVNSKTAAITTQKALCTSLENQLDPTVSGSYAARIQAIVNELALTNTDNFTVDEQAALQNYFIESDLTEDTFVATDIDTTISGQSLVIDDATSIALTGSVVSRVEVGDGINRTIYAFTGGALLISGDQALSGRLVGGTLETASDHNFVFSVHCGEMTVNGISATNLMVTITGTYTSLSSNVAATTIDGVTVYRGTSLTIGTSAATMYATATTSEFQQYTVQRQLYDYAVNELRRLATYTYEFTIEAGNFLFSRQFDQFRNDLELGKGIYLNVGGVKVVTPLIEMSFEFDDESKLDLVFSNRIKRHDPVNTLKDVIEKTYSTTRSIEAGKHMQGLVNDQATAVSQFMNSALDVARNRIIGAGNQSVLIDSAGIHVGETGSNDQLAIVNNMIAMTEDNWGHVKLALGRFRTPDNGTYFGINCEVLAGKLIVGNAMIIEAPGDNGVMQFKVDGTGAWMDNGRLVMRNSAGGQMLIDPTHGIVAGKYNATDGNLFSVSGTSVTTSYLDNQGDPKPNVSFMMDLQTGDAYFAGTLAAKAGEIGGFTIKDKYLHSGSGSTYVELNGGAYDITTNPNGEYAIVVGNSGPSSAKFWVKKDGTIYAQDGTFKGTLNAAKILGALKADEDEGGWIIGPGLSIGPNASQSSGNFYVDTNGNVTMKGSITLTGNITWNNNGPVKYQFSVDGSGNWHDTMTSADYWRRDSLNGGQTWGTPYQFRGKDGKNGEDGSDADVTRDNIARAMYNNLVAHSDDGLYSELIGGQYRLGINATAIRVGDLYGRKYHDEDAYSTLNITSSSNDVNLIFGGFSVSDYDDAAFGFSYDRVGTSITMYVGGRPTLIGSSSQYVNYTTAGNFWYFPAGLSVPCGTSSPNANTPGSGKTGAIYLQY